MLLVLIIYLKRLCSVIIKITQFYVAIHLKEKINKFKRFTKLNSLVQDYKHRASTNIKVTILMICQNRLSYFLNLGTFMNI